MTNKEHGRPRRRALAGTGIGLVVLALAAWPGLGFCAPGAAGAQSPVGSCDARKGVGFCYEYAGSGWTVESAKRECASAPEAVFLEGPCPGAPVSGLCEFDLEGKKERRIVYHFYKDAFSEKQARMSCPGTFTAK